LFFFELVACIAGLACYKKIRHSFWKIFPLYLVFVVLAEQTGNYLRLHYPLEVNVHFYSYFEIPVEFVFFFTLFRLADKRNRYNWISLLCMGTYLACWLVEILLKKPIFFYYFSYTVGNLLLLILILRFFIRLVTSDGIITFKRNMLFWVSLGLLIFYLGSFPYFALVEFMANKYPDLIYTYKDITYFLNCFMYLMFTFSFIWGKPTT
jgi:hypothetical protein